LSKVNLEEFTRLTVKDYSLSMNSKVQSWFASDGKELRGSIKKGSKRGQAIVQIVRHSNREVVGQNFYDGKKESEVPAVKELLEQTKIKTQKVSLDALHLNPNTLNLISKAGGKFLVGLKENQPILAQQMNDYSYYHSSLYHRLDQERGHGREEERFYLSYDLKKERFDERWVRANFQTMIKVLRKQSFAKKDESLYQESYYLSNIPTKNVQVAEELFDTIRNHWQVEVNNYIRDVVLKEDKLCMLNPFSTKAVACCRTLVMNLLESRSIRNRCEQLDFFADNFKECLKWLRGIGFL
jgi:predicted transposase YbfD/YdcC